MEAKFISKMQWSRAEDEVSPPSPIEASTFTSFHIPKYDFPYMKLTV